jgi:hypothetical protein
LCFRKYQTSNICILVQTLSYLLLNFGGSYVELYIVFEFALTNSSGRLNVRNACPHLVQNLSSCLQPKYVKGKGKGKVHPRTVREGPEGEKRYSSDLSLTSALDVVGGQRHAPVALTPGKRPDTH